MTAAAPSRRYCRPASALWRDTGAHVVVLPQGEDTEVKVLGGGGALLWRVLEQPRSVSEVLGAFDEAGVPPPPQEEVEACIADLLDQKLLETSEAS